MANLSSRITALEQLRGAPLEPMFYMDLPGKAPSIEAWAQEVADEVARIAEEEQHTNH